MAADTATKALTTDERAWVGFHGMDTQLQAGKPIQSRITFTNTGRTPAKTLRAAAAIEILPVGTSPSFALDDAPLSTNYSVVFPNNSAQVTVPDVSGRLSKTVATKEMVLAINGGTYVVYVHGRVSYDDIFDNHHWLTFCTQTTADLLTWNMCPSGSPSGNDLDK